MALLPDPRDDRPPYATWVTPWILENLDLVRRSLKVGLDSGTEIDTQAMDGWLREAGGGFWAMGLTDAHELTEKGRALVGEMGSTSPARLEKLVLVQDWLEDTALSAQMGHTPHTEAVLDLLAYLDSSESQWKSTHVPTASAALELTKAMEELTLRFRDLCGQWPDCNTLPDPGIKKEAGLFLEGLTRSMTIVNPDASVRIEELTTDLERAVDPQLIFKALEEAGGALLCLPSTTSAFVVSRGQVCASDAQPYLLKEAHKELAIAMHQELARIRASVSAPQTQGEEDADLEAGLKSIAGALIILGAESAGRNIMSTAQGKTWAQDVGNLAEDLSMAEGLVHALETRAPHMMGASNRSNHPDKPEKESRHSGANPKLEAGDENKEHPAAPHKAKPEEAYRLDLIESTTENEAFGALEQADLSEGEKAFHQKAVKETGKELPTAPSEDKPEETYELKPIENTPENEAVGTLEPADLSEGEKAFHQEAVKETGKELPTAPDETKPEETYELKKIEDMPENEAVGALEPANLSVVEKALKKAAPDKTKIEENHEPKPIEDAPRNEIENATGQSELDEDEKVFLEEAPQLMSAVGQLLPQWIHEPKLEASMAIRRAFHTLKGAAGARGHHDIERLAGAVESILNDALSQIHGPPVSIRQGVAQAHACLGDALSGDSGEWMERGLDALDMARNKATEKSAAIARKEWKAIPSHSKDLFHEFMGSKWPILTRPEHRDFWMALRILETALKMVGADGYTLSLSISQRKKRLTSSARQCLEVLYQEHLDVSRGLPAEQLLALLDENIRLAKEALARKDTQSLDLLLQEQSHLLSEHGRATQNP